MKTVLQISLESSKDIKTIILPLKRDIYQEIKKQIGDWDTSQIKIEDIEFNLDEFPMISTFLLNYFLSPDKNIGIKNIILLNEIASILDKFNQEDLEKLESIFEYYDNLSKIEELFESEWNENPSFFRNVLKNFVFLRGITSEAGLALDFLENIKLGKEYSRDFLYKYVDLVKLGSDIASNMGGVFTQYGFIYKKLMGVIMHIEVCWGIKNTGNFVWVDLPINKNDKEEIVEYILQIIKKEHDLEVTLEDISIVDVGVESISEDIYLGFSRILVDESIDIFLTVNDFMWKFQDDLDKVDREKVESAFAYDSSLYDLFKQHDADYILNYIMEKFEFFPGIYTNTDLGEYVYVNRYDPIPDTLAYYLDFEALGRDFAIETSGDFTEYGYIYNL